MELELEFNWPKLLTEIPKFNAVNAASAKEEREMFFYSSPSNGGGGLGGDPLSGIVIADGSGGERGASVVKAI